MPHVDPPETSDPVLLHHPTRKRYFPSIDDMIESIENLFESWHNGNDTLRRLCAIT